MKSERMIMGELRREDVDWLRDRFLHDEIHMVREGLDLSKKELCEISNPLIPQKFFLISLWFNTYQFPDLPSYSLIFIKSTSSHPYFLSKSLDFDTRSFETAINISRDIQALPNIRVTCPNPSQTKTFVAYRELWEWCAGYAGHNVGLIWGWCGVVGGLR
jgi:hypothetical protein